MRVLHIVGDSKWGGGGSIILGLVEMARDLGWQPEVLATDPVCCGTFERCGVKVVPLDVIRRSINPFRDLLGLYNLHQFLRRERFDLVHTHTSKAGFVGRIAARMAGVPLIIHTAHSFSFHEASSPIASLACRTLEMFAAFFCDRIVTVSNYHRDWGLRLRIAGPGKLIAVQNGIREPARSVRSIESVRSDLGIKDEELMILTPGRVVKGKGLEYLIEAVPTMTREANVPFKVLIAGDGALRPVLERRAADLGINDRLLFLGFRKDIGDLLAASNVVVLPSLHEGMSMALLEAMAARKPIITTNIGGNFEATGGGDGALLVSPRCSRSLATALVKLMTDRISREALSSRARQLYELNHTESRMLEGYKRVYLTMANPRTIGGRIASRSLWHPKE